MGKTCSNEVGNDGDPVFPLRVAQVRESLASESAFHLKKVDKKLQEAATYAADGNRRLMECSVQDATKHAELAGAGAQDDAAFAAKIARIRESLTSESAFHLKKVDKKLQEAATRAADGNRCLMEYSVQEATKHAELAGTGAQDDAAFTAKIARIRESLTSQRAFHLGKNNVDLAATHTAVSNRVRTAFCLKEATKDTRLVGTARDEAVLATNNAQSCEVSASDTSLHLSKVESNIDLAATYAAVNNRTRMEFCLQMAMKHAKLADSTHDNAALNATITQIRESLSSKRSFPLAKGLSTVNEVVMSTAKPNCDKMGYCLEETARHSHITGTTQNDAAFMTGIVPTGQALISQSAFHLVKAISNADLAVIYAAEGNRTQMEVCFEEIATHTRLAGIKGDDAAPFTTRIAQIRNSLASETSFHLGQVKSSADTVTTNATEAD